MSRDHLWQQVAAISNRIFLVVREINMATRGGDIPSLASFPEPRFSRRNNLDRVIDDRQVNLPAVTRVVTSDFQDGISLVSSGRFCVSVPSPLFAKHPCFAVSTNRGDRTPV